MTWTAPPTGMTVLGRGVLGHAGEDEYYRVTLICVRTTIFLPDDLHIKFDATAAANGMNRSEFFQRAGERYVRDLSDNGRVDAINAAADATAAAGNASGFGAEAARRLIDSGSWEW